MENQPHNSGPNPVKKITEKLLERSAALKIKTAQAVERLEELKKQTENLLSKNNDLPDHQNS